MKGSPVHLRGPIKPRTPVASPFMFGDQAQFMEFVKQVIEMRQTLEQGLKMLGEKTAAFDEMKRGPAGVAPTAEEVAQALRKYLPQAPTASEVADELRPHLKAPAAASDIAALAAKLVVVPEPPIIDLDAIAALAATKVKVKKAKAAVVPTKEDIASHVIDTIKAGKLISLEHVAGWKEGLEQTLSPIRRLAEGFRGGGDTVVAGPGIVITNTVGGNKQITAPGTGSSVYTQKLLPTQAGSSITLDLSLLDHTLGRVLGIYKNGQLLDPADPSFGWSVTGSTATVLSAFDTDVFLVNYSTS